MTADRLREIRAVLRIARTHFQHARMMNGCAEYCVACRCERALSALAELDARFPCGHRKVDWDDSYGGCALCPLLAIQQECEREDHALKLEWLAELEGERAGEQITQAVVQFTAFGKSHAECFGHISKPGERHQMQGFATSHGRIVGREEAFAVATAAGQLAGRTKHRPEYLLMSEDLWSEAAPAPEAQPAGGEPRCATCGNPATCLARYDNMEEPEYACDSCCGHSCEGGICLKLPAPSQPPAQPSPALALTWHRYVPGMGPGAVCNADGSPPTSTTNTVRRCCICGMLPDDPRHAQPPAQQPEEPER